MRALRPFVLMPVLVVLVLAVLTLPATTAPDPDASSDPGLWLARGGRLLHLSASGAVLGERGRDVRAVAADPARGRLWTFSRELLDDGTPATAGTLNAWSRDGKPDADTVLDGLANAPARLAAMDGTVWLGVGDVLYRFDDDATRRAGGAHATLVRTLPLAANLRALDVRPDGLLDVLTDTVSYTFNAEGELVTADAGPPVVDLLAGAWALAGGRLVHLTADGVELDPPAKRPFVALAAAPGGMRASGATGGAWVATDAELLYVDDSGRVVRTVKLPGDPAPTFGLALDPGRARPRPYVPRKQTEPVLEGPAALPLSDELPEQTSEPGLPRVVLTETVTLFYTGGTTVLLSSTEDGTGEILSDDAVRLTVAHEGQGEATLEIDFYDEATGDYEPRPPVDVTELMEPGENTVTLEVLDTRLPRTWSWPYFLVQPRAEYSRVLGGSNPSVFAVGGSVDLASGNYLRAETDLTIPAPGLGVSFTRTYNSLDTSGGAFGFGWSSPYDSRATRYTDRLGGEWRYAYDDAHRLLSVTDPDGAVVVANVYGADGRLVSTTDGAGQGWSTELELLDDGRSALYDGNGNLLMIATLVTESCALLLLRLSLCGALLMRH